MIHSVISFSSVPIDIELGILSSPLVVWILLFLISLKFSKDNSFVYGYYFFNPSQTNPL